MRIKKEKTIERPPAVGTSSICELLLFGISRKNEVFLKKNNNIPVAKEVKSKSAIKEVKVNTYL